MSTQIKLSDLEPLLKDFETQYQGDNILDVYGIPNWTADNEKDYNKLASKFDKLKIKTKHYEIYAWYDISGFDYWVKQMKEENYLQVTVKFENDYINKKQIPALLNRLEKLKEKAEKIIYSSY